MFPKPKASTTARGYGATHQAERKRLLPTAYGKPCTKCGLLLLPGQLIELDHNSARTGYLGFAHRRCNRAAGARKRNRRAARIAIVKSVRPSTASRW